MSWLFWLSTLAMVVAAGLLAGYSGQISSPAFEVVSSFFALSASVATLSVTAIDG